MTGRDDEDREETQSGLTLIEVVIYVSLTALVVTVLAGLFSAGVRAQAVTRQRDVATGTANLITSSLHTSLRNASAFEVTGDVLRARVATAGTGWQCRYWRLTPEGELLLATSATKVADPAGEAAWTTLAGTNGPGQEDAEVSVTGNLAHDAGFARVSPGAPELTYDLTVAAGDVEVRVNGAVLPSAAGTGEPSSC